MSVYKQRFKRFRRQMVRATKIELIFLKAGVASFAAAGLFLSLGRVHAQNAEARPAAAAVMTFDVVAIKPNKTGDRGSNITFSNHASFSATNASVKALLQAAFRMRRDLVFDVPKWAQEERFDIEAKVVDPDPSAVAAQNQEQRTAMLQTLLTEHFKLKAHREMRTLPLYELIVSRGGSIMTVAEAPGKGPSGTRGGRGDLTGLAAPMDMLANVLSNEMSAVVVNKTGLPDRYNFHLKWDAQQNSGATRGEAGDEEAPSIFTAVQEQLGLKLQPAKGPVQVLVVDSVERPAEN